MMTVTKYFLQPFLLSLSLSPCVVHATRGQHDLLAEFQAVYKDNNCDSPSTPKFHACRCEVLRQRIECEKTQSCGPLEDDDRSLLRGRKDIEGQDRKLSGNCINGKAAGLYDCSNVDLLKHLSAADLGVDALDDIWGWTASDGREFAIVDGYDAIVFVEISDPVDPKIIGSLGVEASGWHDAKTYNNQVYIVSEASGHQMKVFDLTQLTASDISTPATFTPDATHEFDESGTAHNIVINEETGFAYIVGSNSCNGGLLMLNLNPLNPSDQGSCFSNDGYTHDAQCVIYQGPDTTYQGSEICFACNENSITIVDVSNKNSPTMISRKASGWGNDEYVHQGWLSEDHRYFFVDEEFSGGRFKTKVLDVTSLSSPQGPEEYNNVDPGMEHNQYIRGNMMYQAHYREGLRVLRINNGATADMTEVGFFDTHPQASGNGYNGAWSNYPYFPSCTIVVSDIENGLFVLRGTNAAQCADGGTTPPTNPAATTPAPPGDCTNLVVTIVTDNYPEETTWKILQGQNEIETGGSYTSSGTTYTSNICLNDGDYEFEIADSYGDGVCCDYGNGSFSLTLDGSVIHNGGQFGSQDSHSFTVVGSGGPPPVVVCENSETWRFENNRQKIKDCDWVAKKPDKRCNKAGYEGSTTGVLSSEGCPVACSTCP